MLRKRFFMLLAATIIIGGLASCKSTKTPVMGAQMTQKDSLLMQINDEYIRTSVVGEGAIIARQEARKIAYQRNLDMETRLNAIPSIKIKRVPHNGDSICDFTAELGDILFAYDSFELTPEATEVINQLANVIVGTETHVDITGYTDNTGDDAYNLNLSKLRALSVGSQLRENGFTDITEIGRGKENPVADNKTEKGRQKNRRVEVKIITPEVN